MRRKSGSRVLVVGSSNTDLVLRLSRLPGPGETVGDGRFDRFAGGKGANQAVAAARAGVAVALVGARGDDAFGREAASGLRREGIDTRGFRIKRGEVSGVALILVGGRGKENMIGVARSANAALTAADVGAARAAFRGASVVLAQLEIPFPAVQAAAEAAAETGALFLLTPAPVRRLPAALLRRVDILLPNEPEVRALTGARDARRGAQMLVEAGCGTVVVTRGARGVLIVGPEGVQAVPAPRVRPVDTVGAGDCFSGWLAAGLAEGRPLPEAAARAVRAASLAVTRPGAQAGMPYRREVAE